MVGSNLHQLTKAWMHLRHQLPLRSSRILQIRCQSTSIPTPRSSNEDIATLRAALKGTVPEHQSLLLLHTKTPPNEWPTDVSKFSPLLREILPHVKNFHGKVLLCYPSDELLRSRSTNLMTKGQSRDYRPYTATFFSKLTPPFEIPLLNQELLPQFLHLFKARTQTGMNVASVLEPPQTQTVSGKGPSGSESRSVPGTSNFQARSIQRSSQKSQEVERKRVKQIWILVCTHGARDCRCGNRGPAVAEAAREYVRQKGLERSVIVGEVSHVGGHRYAPNVLVYPYGDWYGTLQPSEVESFMESLLGVEGEDSLSGPQSPLWRGSWFDHPGVPTMETHGEEIGVGNMEENVLRDTSIPELERQRLQSRLALELMRAERDGYPDNKGWKGELEATVEENWGMDLDKLGKGD